MVHKNLKMKKLNMSLKKMYRRNEKNAEKASNHGKNKREWVFFIIEYLKKQNSLF